MTRRDRAAFKRAIEMARAESPATRAQIDEKLRTEPWAEVAQFAAYACQDAALQLKPWMWPPCWLRTDDDVRAALAEPEDHTGRRAAAELVVRLLAAGCSRYEPDVVGALQRAERGQ